MDQQDPTLSITVQAGSASSQFDDNAFSKLQAQANNPAESYTHDNVSARMMFEDIPLDKTKTYYKSQANKAIKKVEVALKRGG